LPECELGPAHCFFPGGLAATLKIVVGESVNRQKKKQTAGPCLQSGIVSKCKSARLAGLPPSLRFGAP
jgi:hypothetical protein